ncbi:hypothetical protein C8J57DRAFT_1644688 [Mycena rebaudengoi]|nr:hypothetical protein C8J57DRAFT_1644688 [Mycena rebaudengoi]
MDYPHVRLTIHIGLPRNATIFKQQAERAGRDGQIAWNFIGISRKGTKPWEIKDNDDLAGTQFMWDFVHGEPRKCYTWQMTGFMDGTARSCTDLQRELPCEICKVAGVKPGPTPVIEKPENPSLVWTGPSSQRGVKRKLKEAFGSATLAAVEKTGKKACERPEAITILQGCLDRVGKACGLCFALGVRIHPIPVLQ